MVSDQGTGAEPGLGTRVLMVVRLRRVKGTRAERFASRLGAALEAPGEQVQARQNAVPANRSEPERRAARAAGVHAVGAVEALAG